jgi:hypothetical protein
MDELAQPAEAGPPSRRLRERFEFIEFRLLWEGRINRADLTTAFGYSEQQASLDIAQYQKFAPGNLLYDLTQKAYLRAPAFEPHLIGPLIDRYLLQLMAIQTRQIPQTQTFFGLMPPSKVASLPHAPTRWDIVMRVAEAIRQKREVRIEYASLNPDSRGARSVAPHALGYGSGRWHMRAWSSERNDFRDFTFDRIQSIQDVGPSPVEELWDRSWHEDFRLSITPNPHLPEKVQKKIASQHGMKAGRLLCRLPISLCFYLINDLDLDLARKVNWGSGDKNTVSPYRIQLALQNWNEYWLAEKKAKAESAELLARKR